MSNDLDTVIEAITTTLEQRGSVVIHPKALLREVLENLVQLRKEQDEKDAELQEALDEVLSEGTQWGSG